MLNMQKNPHIDRIVDFLAKFAPSLSNSLNKTKANDKLSESTAGENNNNNNNNNNTTVIAAANGNKVASNGGDETQSQQSENTTMMDFDEEDEENDNPFLICLIDFLIEVIL
jgi:hypothetical protein